MKQNPNTAIKLKVSSRLYKLLESGNGTKISDKKWGLIKPKYLANKKL